MSAINNEALENMVGLMVEGFDPSMVEENEYDKDWQTVYAAYQNSKILQGTLTGIETQLKVPCGIVYVGHIRGLIPLEFTGLESIQQLRKLTGQQIAFKVLNYDTENNLFTGSRKAALEHMASNTWKRLEEGMVIYAVAKSVNPREVKADIGGILVKIPIQEIDYGWIDDLTERVKPGDAIKVKVTELDKENQKVTVSAKQAKKNPWPDCSKRYNEHSEYVGRVSGVRQYGVFVNLEPDVDALVPHLKFDSLQKGDKVLMRVTKVNVKEEKIEGKIVRKI